MLNAKQATVKYSEGGMGKTTMPLGKMFALAFMAGMFISFAGVASSVAATTVENASLGKLIAALIFPAGLAMVILNNSELFTGNNLLIISVLDKRIKFYSMLKNWIVVYIGNFVGSIFVTGGYALGHEFSLFNNGVAKNIMTTAVAKCNLSFSDAFIKGIFCNILVCVAVMMALTAERVSGKIMALFLPIMVFVISGFEHSVANMSYISGGLFIHSQYGSLGIDTTGLTWYNFLVSNLVPVTLGNIVGGLFIGFMFWFTARDKK